MASKSGPDIIEDGLVLCLDAASKRSYPGTGTVWTDLKGVNNGTLTNGPTFDAGNGGSIVFDGGNDYVSILNNGKGSVFETNSYTVESFVYIDALSVNPRTIWSYDYTSFDPPYYSQHFRIGGGVAANGLRAAYNINGTYYYLEANGNLNNINRWYALSTVITSSRQELWINGDVVASSSEVISNILYYNQVVNIGRLPTYGAYFSEKISSVRMYNRALTPDEIRRNYLSTKERFA